MSSKKSYGSITIVNMIEPFSIILTNEADQFYTDSFRCVLGTQQCETDVLVYQGGTERTDFTIGTISPSSGINVSKTGKTIAFSVSDGTTLTADSGTFEIPITLDGKTINKIFSWTCSKEGTAGTPAKSVNITASSQVFKSTDGGITFSPDTIRLTPDFQGEISFSKWQYSTDGGTLWNDISNTNEYGLTLSSSALIVSKTSSLFTDTNTSISFKCISDNSSYYDTITVIKLYDVTDIKIGGRNLLTPTITAGSQSSITENKYEIQLPCSQDASISFILNLYKDLTLEQTYTLSCTCSGLKTGTSFYFTESSGVISECNLPITKNGRCYTTFQITQLPSSTLQLALQTSNRIFGADQINSAVILSEFKLEKGNKNTDFSPAPEDIQAQITENTSSISGVDSKVNKANKNIEDKVWQTDITEKINSYDNSTVNSIRERTTALEEDLSGITTRVSDVETTVESKADGSTVQTLSENFTSFKQTSEAFQATVESTYAKESDLSDVRTIANQTATEISWLVEANSSSTSIVLTDNMISAITTQFVVKDPDGNATIIEGGKIKANAITTNMLSTDVIKSLNYVSNTSGSFLDLSDGSFDSKFLKWDNTGKITSTSGKIGNWDINETSIFKGNGWKDATSGSAYFGDNGLSITDKFWVDSSGNTNVEGTIISSNGKIGNWDINESSIFKSDGWKSSTSGSAYFGDNGLSITDKFWVDSTGTANIEGTITATAGDIGRFHIDELALVTTVNNNTAGLGGSSYSFWAGNTDPTVAPFSVDYTGSLFASSGKIGGWNLTEEMFYAGTEIEGEWDNCIRPNRITMLNGTLDMQNGIGSFKSLSSDTCDVTTINATTGNFTNIACSEIASHGGDIKFTALARYVRDKDGNVIIGENAKGRLLIGNNTQTSNLCGLTTSTTSTGVSFKICNGVGIVDTSEDELDYTDQHINIYLSGGTDATSRYIRSMPAYQRTFGTSSPAMRISDSGTIGRTASSSARYKHDITALSHPENVTQEIENSLSKQEYIDNINSLLDLPVSAFKYNEGYFTGEPNYDYDTVTIGFIAEDVAKFCPDCAIYQMETIYKTDDEGNEIKDSSGTRIPLYDKKTDVVESWSEREFIPKIVYLLQQQDKKIKELEQEIISLKESR